MITTIIIVIIVPIIITIIMVIIITIIIRKKAVSSSRLLKESPASEASMRSSTWLEAAKGATESLPCLAKLALAAQSSVCHGTLGAERAVWCSPRCPSNPFRIRAPAFFPTLVWKPLSNNWEPVEGPVTSM